MTFVQKLALPTLVAAFLVSMPGASPATPVAAGRAATVIASMHYQAALTLTCTGDTCTGDFPAVPNRRRLTLSRISCHLHSAQYAAYGSGQVRMRTAGNLISLVQFLPAQYSTEWGFHLINAATDAQFAATQRVSVLVSVAQGSGTAYDAQCTAHGTMDLLQ